MEAQALSDRVAVLGGGALLALGTPAELARQISPRLEVTIEIDPTRHADAIALIASLDGLTVASERSGVVRVGGIPRERVPDVAARLVAGGIGLYRLEPHEPSLTDAYFALQQSGGGPG